MDGNRFVVRVCRIPVDLDRAVGPVDVALAVERTVESSDEAAFGVVESGREPPFGIIGELVAKVAVADVSPDRRHPINEHESESDVDDAGGGDVPEGSEAGAEGDRNKDETREPEKRAKHAFERQCHQAQHCDHGGLRA
jgi:hypothetical protein